MSGQYGEDKIILDRFQGRSPGFVVDVGAHDGEENSNTQCLLELGWGGILIEPNPVTFPILQARWGFRYPEVRLVNSAISSEEGDLDFYVWGQCSTLDKVWRDRCIELYKAEYMTTQVVSRKLSDVLWELNAPKKIDLLSIDCEGRDLDVLSTMDWKRFEVEMIIVEDGGADALLIPLGFRQVDSTIGNAIYVQRVD